MKNHRRERGRALGVVLLIVFLAVVGVAGWYFLVYTRSPQYALDQFLSAVGSGDANKANEWTDTGGGLLSLAQQMMTMQGIAVNPVSFIYPGFQGSTGLSESSVVWATAGRLEQVDENNAKVPMTLLLKDKAGETRPITPTFFLRKNPEEGKWKVAVEPTFCRSFDQYLTPPQISLVKRGVRLGMMDPTFGPVVRQIISSSIQLYPNLKRYLQP